MARLLKGVPIFTEGGQREGVSILYLVGRDVRTLWLPEADIAGLDLAQIKALAQSRANSDPGLPGPSVALFDNEREAKEAFDDLPGWATWTAVEAEAWIQTNVTDLTSAKTALKAMAKAIVYLRDVMLK